MFTPLLISKLWLTAKLIDYITEDDGSVAVNEVRILPPCGFSRQLQSVEVKLSISELQSSKTATVSKKQNTSKC